MINTKFQQQTMWMCIALLAVLNCSGQLIQDLW